MRAWQAATLLALVLAIAGCGGSSDSGDATTTPPEATFPEPTVPKGAPQPPKGSPPVVRDVYRQFTLRKPDPRVKGSAKAIAAGRAACKGLTPVDVERKYYPMAVAAGGLEADSGQAKMIAEIGKYAKQATRDPSFVAGQLAADAYQATLPQRVATFGYGGCVYELARRLEKQLQSGK